MKQLRNVMVLVVAIATINLFSMDIWTSEGVISREHEEDLFQAEENRRRQEMERQLQRDRAQARQQAMARRQQERQQRQVQIERVGHRLDY